MRPLAVSIASGVALSALAWVDPIFIPLVIAGPPISGAIAASRAVATRWVALAWAVAGLGMIISDWVVNREDVAFHVVLTAVMAGLATAAALATGAIRRRGSAPNTA